MWLWLPFPLTWGHKKFRVGVKFKDGQEAENRTIFCFGLRQIKVGLRLRFACTATYLFRIAHVKWDRLNTKKTKIIYDRQNKQSDHFTYKFWKITRRHRTAIWRNAFTVQTPAIKWARLAGFNVPGHREPVPWAIRPYTNSSNPIKIRKMFLYNIRQLYHNSLCILPDSSKYR
jgi:hypothetical protein